MESIITDKTIVSNPSPSKSISSNSPFSTSVTDKITLSSSSPSKSIPVPTGTADNSPISFSNKQSSGINFIKILKYILIIFILGFLAYNLFAYLGRRKLIGPRKFTHKAVKSLDINKKHPPKAKKSGIKTLEKTINHSKVNRNKIDDNSASLGRALKHAQKHKHTPSPDQAGSLTQNNRRFKSGFCYIGEDRGVRSCVKVKHADMCMSGDIFPTQAVCINPNLRE